MKKSYVVVGDSLCCFYTNNILPIWHYFHFLSSTLAHFLLVRKSLVLTSSWKKCFDYIYPFFEAIGKKYAPS